MSLLKFDIGDYCDLESTEIGDDGMGAVVARDGSMATIIRYNGFRTMVSKTEFTESIERFAISAQSYLGTKGHQIQVVFDRDEDPLPEMDQYTAASYLTAKRLNLDVADLLDETKLVLARKCSSEAVFFVLWTRPSLLAPIEAKIYAQELQQAVSKVPPMKDTQNPLRTIRFLVDRHNAVVQKFLQDLWNIKGSAHILPVHAALRETRASMFPEVTPPEWRPTVLGDEVYGRWQKKITKDVSAALPQPLRHQLMPLDAFNGDEKTTGSISDTRAVRVGGRIFAPCFVSMFPQHLMVFESLFRELNLATTATKFGQKPMPWRLSFMIEGDGLSGKTMAKVFAGILGLTSESNRNLVKTITALNNYKSSGFSIVKVQISAMTWAPYGDERELMLRRSKLVRALTAWGNANVNEETGDPAQGLVNCALGMTYKSTAPSTAAPLEDVLTILPLARPASPFDSGHVLFRSLDGKVLPYEMFSAKQATWITLIYAGPGSGKSVLVNRLNTEMCWAGGLSRLPFICVIDIGVSSSGFISLIRESLPDDKKHWCMYTRLQNTSDYTINPCDTMLGCRKPLERERDYIANFLTMLATSPEAERPDEGMRPFAGIVVDAMFAALSDENERANPREYTHGSVEVVTAAVERCRISWNEATTWWRIVDELFAAGEIHAAYCAQRYAMPTLTDAVRAASDPAIARDFGKLMAGGMSVAEKFCLMVGTAITEYPIFASNTAFDVGEARLMAIDLNDVVTTGSPAARKKASLMYMTARSLFVKKIAISAEDLPYVNPRYRQYHAERFKEVKEIQKRLVYDEYHKTGGDPTLNEQATTDGREGRKWGLEVMMSSQLPQDFKDISQLATTIFVLDAGSPQTRKNTSDIFGLSPAEMNALVNHCHGPTAEGATFLGIFATGESRQSQLFTSTMSPKMLWGLSTGQEDRVIRDFVYQQLGVKEGRSALAWAFPKGSARAYVQKMRGRATTDDEDGWIDENEQGSLLLKIAQQDVIDRWVSFRERGVP
jgi:intracellular multiplication protein IcmB